jgi:hypothetical protein
LADRSRPAEAPRARIVKGRGKRYILESGVQ